MPTVRYTAEGGRYRTGGVTFEPGDTHDVSPGKAEHLVEEVGDFEYAADAGEPAGTAAASDEAVDGDVHEEDGPPDAAADGDDAGDNSAAGENDDGDDGFDIDAWLDQGYQTRADRVEAGEVDAHLDTIADAETADTVTDAVGIRRAELAEE